MRARERNTEMSVGLTKEPLFDFPGSLPVRHETLARGATQLSAIHLIRCLGPVIFFHSFIQSSHNQVRDAKGRRMHKQYDACTRQAEESDSVGPAIASYRQGYPQGCSGHLIPVSH